MLIDETGQVHKSVIKIICPQITKSVLHTSGNSDVSYVWGLRI